MEEQNRVIKKGMPLWLSISLIVLVAGMGTGGTWYVMDQKVKKNDDKITTLQSQVDKLTKDAVKVTPTPTTTVTPTPTEVAAGNIFDLLTAKNGDKVSTMTIVSVNPFSMTLQPPINNPLTASNANVVFSGQAVLEGDYSYTNSAFSGGYDLVFNVKSSSYSKLPVIKGAENHQLPMWFSNKAEAMRILGITENVEKSGTATITIKDYVMNRYPSELRDTFALVSVN